MRQLNGSIRAAVCLATLTLFGTPTQADLSDLLGRVPPESNALVIIDAAKVLKSPMGVKEGWADQRASGSRPSLVPAGAQRVVLASQIDYSDMAPLWEIAMMDMDRTWSLDKLAKAEGGFADNFGDAPGVWSPIDAYFIQATPRVLGVVAPGNRQFAARWLRQPKSALRGNISPYLKNAASTAESGADLVMALDLEDAVSPARVQRGLERLASMGGKNVDKDALGKLFTSLKGLTVTVKFTQDATGKITIDFGQDAAPLAEFAKPLLMEVLADHGFSLDDLKNWKASITGKSINLEGNFSKDGLRSIFSVIEPPAPRNMQQSDAPADAAANVKSADNAPNTKAAASQAYFTAVSEILETLDRQITRDGKGASLNQMAGWMRRDARRIDRLPALNVDSDLLNYGVSVSTALNAAAGIYEVHGTQAKSRAAGIQNSSTYSGTDAGKQAAMDRIKDDADRRQAILEEKTAAQSESGKYFADVREGLGKIRVSLAEKYQVNF